MIFILGLTQRTGTNYLADILRLHKKCVFDSSIPEDKLNTVLPQAQQLITELTSSWNPSWIKEGNTEEKLFRNIGKGLTDAIGAKQQLSVLRSPNIKGLSHLFQFFEKPKVIVLVRDGRDVAVSYKNTWPSWTLRKAAKFWVSQSELLRFYLKKEGLENEVYQVKYEDLFSNTQNALQRLFEFLEISFDDFDYQKLDDLGIKGSSELEKVHWQPVKIDNFNPVGRWKGLSKVQKGTLNRICAKELRYLGY